MAVRARGFACQVASKVGGMEIRDSLGDDQIDISCANINFNPRHPSCCVVMVVEVVVVAANITKL